MKIVLLLLCCLATVPCAQEAGTEIKNEKGTMVKVGNFGYGIVPDSREGSRFAPTPLPEEFKVDGLRVRFSGIVGEVPSSGPRGRVWGTPFELKKIEKLVEEKQD